MTKIVKLEQKDLVNKEKNPIFVEDKVRKQNKAIRKQVDVKTKGK